jgi:UDP-N-acetyl-D-glucosamine dehydrogenase
LLTDVFVVGLGYVGLPIAITAAESNFKVIGYDINEEKIQELKQGQSFISEISSKKLMDLQIENKLSFQHFISEIDKPAIWIIAVPTPLDNQKRPDLSMLVSACETIAKFVSDDSLIINESTSYVGTLRNLIKPTIDRISGKNNLRYAVAPERIDPGNTNWNMLNTPRVISGLDSDSISAAKDFYNKFCPEVLEVSSPEVAEASKLLENTFRQVNIAFVNDFSIFANKLGLSTFEIIKAASTKPFGFMPFYPGIGVGGHCIPVDPSYLAKSYENAGLDSKFINLSNSINRSMANNISDRIEESLGKEIKGMHIQIAGVSYKLNSSDIRESPALELISEFRERGAKVTWFDPLVSQFNDEFSLNDLSSCDLGLIVTPHNEINFDVWKKLNITVFDLSSTPKFFGWPKFF